MRLTKAFGKMKHKAVLPALLCLILTGIMLWMWVFDRRGVEGLPEISRLYTREAINTLQSQNVITPIVLSWRGFDTYGEILILLLATAGVAYGIRTKREESRSKRRGLESTRIAQAGISVLQPLIFIFGAYIFTHGHLSPGGGFPGGIVLSSGFILWIITDPQNRLRRDLLHLLESVFGTVYMVLCLLGLILAGSFMDLTYLPAGRMGELFSSGAVPLIYTAVGIKVGIQLLQIVENFRD